MKYKEKQEKGINRIVRQVWTCLVLFDAKWKDCIRKVKTSLYLSGFVQHEFTALVKTCLDLSSISLKEV